MKTLRIEESLSFASTICRATPLPQSITYEVPFATITCAGADRFGLGVGPPAVPRRMRRDLGFASAAGLASSAKARGKGAAAMSAALAPRNPRRVRGVPNGPDVAMVAPPWTGAAMVMGFPEPR